MVRQNRQLFKFQIAVDNDKLSFASFENFMMMPLKRMHVSSMYDINELRDKERNEIKMNANTNEPTRFLPPSFEFILSIIILTLL